MKKFFLLSCAAGLVLTLAPAAHSIFIPRATLEISFGSDRALATEYVLPRSENGTCLQEMTVSVDMVEGAQAQQASGELIFTSLQHEAIVRGKLRGNCPELREIELLFTRESDTPTQPEFLLSTFSGSPQSNTMFFVAEQDWEAPFTFLLPTAGDRIVLQGWQEHQVSSTSSQPERESLGSWSILQPDAWQQYWHSNLTWPEKASDYFFPPACHTFSQLGFPKDDLVPCIGSVHFAVTSQRASISEWLGWQNVQTIQKLGAQPTRAPSAGEIRITEVLWAGSFSTTANHSTDEWVELFNTTDTVLSLDGLMLQKARTGGQALVFSKGLLIAPHSYFLIGKLNEQSLLSHSPDWYTPNLSLSNTEAGLRLETVTGETIDSLPEGVWQAGENNVSDKKRSSAQLRHLTLPGDQWSSWAHCSREDEERCWQASGKNWKENSLENLASPWQPSVL